VNRANTIFANTPPSRVRVSDQDAPGATESQMVQAKISGAIFHLSHFRVSMKCKLTLKYGIAGRSGPRPVAGNIRRYRVSDIADLSKLNLFRNRGLAEQSLLRARQRVCHESGHRMFLEALHYFCGS
jgi:hypothetical protein